MKKSTLTLATIAMLLAPPVCSAQEVADKNQSPKKLEIGIGARTLQGYSGRVWIAKGPYFVAAISYSREINIPEFILGDHKSLDMQLFTWFGYDPKGNLEGDIGVTLMKDFNVHSREFNIGLQAMVNSIAILGESEPNSNLDIVARIPIAENWGVSFTKDVRKLSSYSIGTSYNMSLDEFGFPKDTSMTYRGEFRNSYTFGPSASVTSTFRIGHFYAAYQMAKGFKARDGEVLRTIVNRGEAGFNFTLDRK